MLSATFLSKEAKQRRQQDDRGFRGFLAAGAGREDSRSTEGSLGQWKRSVWFCDDMFTSPTGCTAPGAALMSAVAAG